MGVAFVHKTLLLVDQLLFEFLLPDILLFHLTGDLLLDSSSLGFTAPRPRLLLMSVLSEQSLVLFLLPGDTFHCILILMLLLSLLLLGRIAKLGEADLSLGNVLGQDVVDVAILFLLLALHLLLPAALQDRLKLFLLYKAQLVGVLK